MNKNKKVLALKYRPSTFEDLIGQDIVAETISNSIKQIKYLMHIYLQELEELEKQQPQELVAKSLNCSYGID